MSHLQIFFLALVMISAVCVVAVRHESRLTFVALQKEEKKRDDLQADWGRLMLEKATWTGQHNVADTARKRLSMSVPEADSIITLELSEDKQGADSGGGDDR